MSGNLQFGSTDPFCGHEVLGFASGSYYVVCQKCHQYWVAKSQTSDMPDYMAGNNPVYGLRVIQIDPIAHDFKDLKPFTEEPFLSDNEHNQPNG